jgi:peptidoglycan/LPS O-acetylase OafA/YrhL
MSHAKITHIEKLRALSILLVLLFHMSVPGFQNGFFGVDIFFVISGFLMATIYGDIATGADIRHFYVRRMSRILPAYYAVILITVVVSFFLLLPHEIQMVMKQSIWAAFFLPNFAYIGSMTKWADQRLLRVIVPSALGVLRRACSGETPTFEIGRRARVDFGPPGRARHEFTPG